MAGPPWNWRFKGYVDAHCRNTIQAWYDSATAPVKVEFRLTLKMLRTRSNNEWSEMGKCKDLKGKHLRGLFELRFTVEQERYRPIGIFGTDQSFTILTVAGKHNFDAEAARAISLKRIVENNLGGRSNECDCLSDITRRVERR